MRIVSRINVPAKFLQRLVNWLIRHQPPQGLLTARTGGELVFRNGRALSINHQRRVSNGPGRVIRVPPGHYEFERWYPLVCLLYAIYFPSEVPDGDLGVYRTPISKLFAEQGRALIERWRAGLTEKSRDTERAAKVAKARQKVALWERRSKLCATKLKVWNRRLAAAERAVEKAKAKGARHGLADHDEHGPMADHARASA